MEKETWTAEHQAKAAAVAATYREQGMQVIVVHSDDVELRKRKFVTRDSVTGAHLMTILRKYSTLESQHAAFLLFRDTRTLVPMQACVVAHAAHLDADGVLHLLLTTENAFGGVAIAATDFGPFDYVPKTATRLLHLKLDLLDMIPRSIPRYTDVVRAIDTFEQTSVRTSLEYQEAMCTIAEMRRQLALQDETVYRV